ncbi:IDUA iduronidase, partial [Polyodon spathula]|nr:IDUA iduronidase [Polyodon spathula]
MHWLLELRLIFCLVLYCPFFHVSVFPKFPSCVSLISGFELMGSASGYFTDFEDKKQVVEWKNRVAVIAKRYINKYGLGYVSQWNFETWNEPKYKYGLGYVSQWNFETWNEPKLHLVSFIFSSLCVFMIELTCICLQGRGSSLHILEQEVETTQEIQKHFHGFKPVPLYSSEADPLVGWSKPSIWRADVTYASMVVKVSGIISGENTQYILHLQSEFLNKVMHILMVLVVLGMDILISYSSDATVTATLILLVFSSVTVVCEKQISSDIGASGESVNMTLGVLASTHETAVTVNLNHYAAQLEKAEVSGFYRMHAVDYWGRPGEYSLPEKYTEEHWNLSFLLKYII